MLSTSRRSLIRSLRASHGFVASRCTGAYLPHRKSANQSFAAPRRSCSLSRTHLGSQVTFETTRLDWKMAGNPEIVLDPTEQKLVSLLDSCCDWINAHHPQPKQEDGGSDVDYSHGIVEARIAGGWVRDKLLGLPSHDLDISLSVMTGLNFAILFKQYLLSNQDDTASSSSSQENDVANAAASAMSRITKIAANPEQSKNLETATANILGLDLDFVNLRKEIYEGDSRIPIMSFGTPKEDAERRDITINSLFYNVKTRTIEDWTGMGLADMRAGLVRTPLPPLTTFLDDPLRVLRCVRFASRFNYRLDETITACLKGQSLIGLDSSPYDSDPRLTGFSDLSDLAAQGRMLLREALMKKVSRERVGIEIDKMMGGPFPLLAHLHLRDLGLYDLVFHPDSLASEGSAVPLRTRPWPSKGQLLPTSDACSQVAIQASLFLDGLSSQPVAQQSTIADLLQESKIHGAKVQPSPAALAKVPSPIIELVRQREQRRRLEFCSAFLALGDQEMEEKKGKWVWAGDRVMMQGLKLGKNHTSLPVTSMVNSVPLFGRPDSPAAVEQWRSHLPQMPSLASPLSTKATLAMLLRDRNALVPAVDVQPIAGIALALIHDLVYADTFETSNRIIDAYGALVAQIEELGLFARVEEKPLLDGNAVLSLLDLKPGPMTPRIQNAVLVWQMDALQCPLSDLSESERGQRCREVSQWLKEAWQAGLIVPLEERIQPKAPKKSAGDGSKKQK